MFTVYSRDNCSYCTSALEMLKQKNQPHSVMKIGLHVTREWVLETFPTMKTLPIILEDGKLIGGYEQLKERFKAGFNVKPDQDSMESS